MNTHSLPNVVRHITNDQEHEAVLQRIWKLIEAEPGTPEGDEFAELVNAAAEYEGLILPEFRRFA